MSRKTRNGGAEMLAFDIMAYFLAQPVFATSFFFCWNEDFKTSAADTAC